MRPGLARCFLGLALAPKLKVVSNFTFTGRGFFAMTIHLLVLVVRYPILQP
jgi:hypothetical protein